MFSNYQITLNGIPIDVVRKRIRNIHFRIYPGTGQVKITAPYLIPEFKINQLINLRLNWIQEQYQRCLQLPKPFKPQYQSGERHRLFGLDYQLEIVSPIRNSKPRIEGDRIVIAMAKDASRAKRQQALEKFYRQELNNFVVPLISRWEMQMGVKLNQFRIKKMKTRWGTCNPRAKRVWLNLELVKKSPQAIESVLVHELVHLFVHGHGPKFKNYMDRFLPDWREREKELDAVM